MSYVLGIRRIDRSVLRLRRRLADDAAFRHADAHSAANHND